jgi:hypothetical protein
MQNKVFATSKKSVSEKVLEAASISLTATGGDTAGEIDLAWEPVAGAYSYLIQKSSGHARPSKWILVDIVAKSSCTISRLKSRHYYWFRVAGVKAKGQGPWSKSVQKKAP